MYSFPKLVDILSYDCLFFYIEFLNITLNLLYLHNVNKYSFLVAARIITFANLNMPQKHTTPFSPRPHKKRRMHLASFNFFNIKFVSLLKICVFAATMWAYLTMLHRSVCLATILTVCDCRNLFHVQLGSLHML